jgi:hypothetical protein
VARRICYRPFGEWGRTTIVKQRADSDSIAGGGARTFVGELELSAPAEERRPASRYPAANVLIRLHGEPLGLVTVPLTHGELVEADVVGRAWEEHGDRIREHLARDGTTSTTGPEGSAMCLRGAASSTKPFSAPGRA